MLLNSNKRLCRTRDLVQMSRSKLLRAWSKSLKLITLVLWTSWLRSSSSLLK
ncbi:hypothetical protein [Aeromonas phage Akh-2]|nr:hypothetical protein [Aeromonas phage Akh-2]